MFLFLNIFRISPDLPNVTECEDDKYDNIHYTIYTLAIDTHSTQSTLTPPSLTVGAGGMLEADQGDQCSGRRVCMSWPGL